MERTEIFNGPKSSAMEGQFENGVMKRSGPTSQNLLGHHLIVRRQKNQIESAGFPANQQMPRRAKSPDVAENLNKKKAQILFVSKEFAVKISKR
jgi:hypothetical protein